MPNPMMKMFFLPLMSESLPMVSNRTANETR